MREESPRQKLIEFIFGPPMKFLLERGITPLLVGLVGLTIMEYFFIFHKRPKKKKFTAYEWFSIIIWAFLLIITIDSQITLIIRQ